MEELVFVFEIDGNAWHCHFQDYVNPMESVEGFGVTKKEALENLLERLGDDLT